MASWGSWCKTPANCSGDPIRKSNTRLMTTSLPGGALSGTTSISAICFGARRWRTSSWSQDRRQYPQFTSRLHSSSTSGDKVFTACSYPSEVWVQLVEVSDEGESGEVAKGLHQPLCAAIGREAVWIWCKSIFTMCFYYFCSGKDINTSIYKANNYWLILTWTLCLHGDIAITYLQCCSWSGKPWWSERRQTSDWLKSCLARGDSRSADWVKNNKINAEGDNILTTQISVIRAKRLKIKGTCRCCSHALVGGAVQSLRDDTWQEVRGNRRKERAKSAVEPQLDEPRVVDVEDVQSDFSYGIQNHWQRRISGVQSLKERVLKTLSEW